MENIGKEKMDPKMSWLKKIFSKSSQRYSLGALITFGFIAGIIFWGGFNTALEASNTEDFCISCHEMNDYVYTEYKESVHYSNKTGIRATCPDCHVPKEWTDKLVRKAKASFELYHKMVGSIDTPEKFEAKRMELAQSVWQRMEESDSQECRNCHDYQSMDYSEQKRRAQTQHSQAFEDGKTCINCHKGIAHSLPFGFKDGSI